MDARTRGELVVRASRRTRRPIPSQRLDQRIQDQSVALKGFIRRTPYANTDRDAGHPLARGRERSNRQPAGHQQGEDADGEYTSPATSTSVAPPCQNDPKNEANIRTATN